MINTIQIQVFQINEKEKCRVRLGSMHQLLLIVVVELWSQMNVSLQLILRKSWSLILINTLEKSGICHQRNFFHFLERSSD